MQSRYLEEIFLCDGNTGVYCCDGELWRKTFHMCKFGSMFLNNALDDKEVGI